MNNTAYLCFCHDLEDGWYELDTPDGKHSYWNFPNQIKEFAEKNNLKLEWRQANSWSDNSMYMPDFMKGTS